MYPGPNNPPLSPPETHASYFSQVPPQHSAPHRAMATSSSSFDLGSGLQPAPMETPTSRFRRGSSIGYINTPGHRELRDRNGSVALKHLVIVVPPPSIAQEHGNLGHTLSNGPANRLSQGLIMPLLPTMYGQLTAIAKEFNFPSPTGICLYYCYTEQGITMTPRLSDDIWQAMWGLGDVHSNAEKRAPIVGKIEFEIDMSQARWYAAWLASRHRDSGDFPTPITAPNLPFRGDNRFSFPAPAPDDNGSVDHQTTQLRSAPVVTRHVPRKLSLMDRFDAGQSDSKTYRSVNSPPTVLPLSSHVLSPIRQQEEPKTAKNDLDERVKSWRASAIVTPPAEEPSEPVPVETAKSPSEAASPASQSSFHLEDYAFSISSAGPDDTSFIGSYHQDYLPSVHMGYRVCGSVALTDSYCTSPGPSDGDFDYDAVSEVSRLPSPDIAYRMFEEAPPSPIPTATSWGAPSEGPWTFSEQAYSPSIDLGFRMNFSAAPSPAPTATSWGAPSYDGWDSPVSHQSYFSVHLCNRGEFSTPPTPQTATSWGAPSCLFSPASPDRLPSPDVGHRLFEESDEFERRAAVAAAWVPPAIVETCDVEVAVDVSVAPVWVPTLQAAPKGRKRTLSSQRQSDPLSGSSGCSQYPSFVLYAPVYPHFDLYPAPAGEVVTSDGADTSTRLTVSLPHITGYPVFTLYSPVYPHFDLYPLVQVLPESTQSSSKPAAPPVTTLPAVKAAISNPSAEPEVPSQAIAKSSPSPPCPAAPLLKEVKPRQPPQPTRKATLTQSAEPWAHSWPYRRPTVSEAARPKATVVPSADEPKPKLPAQPWAHSWPYRKPNATMNSPASSYGRYPCFILYPSVYPHFDLYPPPSGSVAKSVEMTMRSLPATQLMAYPSLIIYPAVYPFNLSELYPGPALEPFTTKKHVAHRTAVDPLAAFSEYPSLCIYHPVYPHCLNTIYPPIAAEPARRKVQRPSAEDPLALFPGYPALNIYRPVYPHHLESIYPAVAKAGQASNRPKACSIELNYYPAMQIYSLVYPHNLYAIYPGPASSLQQTKFVRHGELSNKIPAHYPHLELYPAVYPHFCLWPVVPGLAAERPTARVSTMQAHPAKLRPRRRTHAELHAIVMKSRPPSLPPVAPLPSPPQATLQPTTQKAAARRSGRLTHAELHAMVTMEQRLAKTTSVRSDVTTDSEFSTPGSPISPSPVKRAVAVRFEADVPRKLYSPIRSSMLPPLRSEEPRSELPPVPTSSLSRSTTLPTRRPAPTTEAFPGGRSTVYDPENMRARGLGNNTMSRVTLERRGSSVARRMTIWENGGPTKSPNPTSAAPSIRQAAKNRDSIVMQRIKAFNSPSS